MSIFFLVLMCFSPFAVILGEDMGIKQMTRTEEINSLTSIARQLSKSEGIEAKIALLKEQPWVAAFLANHHEVEDVLEQLTPIKQLIVLSLIAVGEGTVLFYDFEDVSHHFEQLNALLEDLIDVEKFYDTIGGIVGYHLAFLKLLFGALQTTEKEVVYEHPRSLDISKPSNLFYDLTATGVENLPHVAAIFPVGGAGDRLDLQDEKSGVPLPAAKLRFHGRSLLNGMFRDLEGMEYLYYKLTGKSITIPVALMTSAEKQNDDHIRDICERNHWFHRDPKSVYIFKQPMAPVLTKEGRWSFKAPLRLNMKPGGHGVIWKLAIDHKIFKQLDKMGIHKAFLRQVNNPMASIDGNILSLVGEGFRRNAVFGFTTCDRPVHISEGMVVLEHTRLDGGDQYCLKNVEYTDFVKNGLDDQPCEPGSLYSRFPSNTNILFADLKAVAESIEQNPLPGMLINLKAKFPTLTQRGDVEEIYGGRLETVMQNVADHFVMATEGQLCEEDKYILPVFSIYNRRQKTHSTTKRSYKAGVYVDQTPVRCFYDLQATYRELLRDHCQITLSDIGEFDDYLTYGPGIVVEVNPALGPLFYIMGQKIRGGTIADGSELHLDIAELDMENLHLSGCLRIFADSPIEKAPGRCELIDVTVINAGTEFPRAERCWKGDYRQNESLEIVIKGNGEFYAEGVTFKGAHRIEVDNGCRVVAHQEGDSVVLSVNLIHQPTWNWDYRLGKNRRIQLTKR